jgi:hypothetical protein
MYKAFESIIALICNYFLRLLSFLEPLFQSSQLGRFFFSPRMARLSWLLNLVSLCQISSAYPNVDTFARAVLPGW